MKTLTLCGSMRFEKEMRAAAYELETKGGYNILQCVYVPENTPLSAEDRNHLAAAHYAKIDLSDGIYVLNCGGYIGEAVQQEIRYAYERGKEVWYHCPPEP